MQKKFGVFGEPILVGTVLGIIIGVVAGYDFPAILALGINLGAVLVLIPKMAALLMEGLIPVSDAASEFIEKKFSNRGKIYIGLDSAVGVGHSNDSVCIISTCTDHCIPCSITSRKPGNAICGPCGYSMDVCIDHTSG